MLTFHNGSCLFFFSYIHSLLLYIKGIQNKPLWHKNDFELKTSEFLKSLICLRVGTPQRTQLSQITSPGATLISSWRPEVSNTPRHCYKTIPTPIYSPNAHLSFKKLFVLP